MHVRVLPVKFDYAGKVDCLYPVLLQDETKIILVDCGYPGFLPLIEDAARETGLSLQHLTGVIITHHDLDHVGGLAELKEKFPQVKVYSPVMEAQYISGKAKSLRLVQAENLFPTLPEDQKAGALHFQEMLRNIRPVEVDCTFAEDGEPDFLPGVRIVHTPGHMPGHISLYLEATKTLVAADAVVYENGELEIANPHFTLDLPGAVASVEKLQQLETETLVCYHGGVVTGDIRAELGRLVRKYDTKK
jgi:glyoxylase-like metal-dependent hydrolase (beta-lactamase superfamily II)